jgi:hypothetical protein
VTAPVGRRPDPRTDRRLLVSLAAPLVVAVLAAGWLLWTRADPARQGGYCMNATVEIAGVLRRSDTSGDVGRGPLPPVAAIFAQVGRVDADRFRVDTPPELRDEVDELARTHSTDAFAALVADYLDRCRTGHG